MRANSICSKKLIISDIKEDKQNNECRNKYDEKDEYDEYDDNDHGDYDHLLEDNLQLKRHPPST